MTEDVKTKVTLVVQIYYGQQKQKGQMLKTIITNTQIKSKCKYPNNTNIAMLFTTYIQNEKQTTHEKSLTLFYLNL